VENGPGVGVAAGDRMPVEGRHTPLRPQSRPAPLTKKEMLRSPGSGGGGGGGGAWALDVRLIEPGLGSGQAERKRDRDSRGYGRWVRPSTGEPGFRDDRDPRAAEPVAPRGSPEQRRSRRPARLGAQRRKTASPSRWPLGRGRRRARGCVHAVFRVRRGRAGRAPLADADEKKKNPSRRSTRKAPCQFEGPFSPCILPVCFASQGPPARRLCARQARCGIPAPRGGKHPCVVTAEDGPAGGLPLLGRRQTTPVEGPAPAVLAEEREGGKGGCELGGGLPVTASVELVVDGGS